MTSGKLTESINPLRKAGEIMGRLESQEKTSADADRIVSGEDEITHILSIYTLGASIELGEERLPESYIEGYRAGMGEKVPDMPYTEVDESDTLYSIGD
jgi:hypothetical protein